MNQQITDTVFHVCICMHLSISVYLSLSLSLSNLSLFLSILSLCLLVVLKKVGLTHLPKSDQMACISLFNPSLPSLFVCQGFSAPYYIYILCVCLKCYIYRGKMLNIGDSTFVDTVWI